MLPGAPFPGGPEYSNAATPPGVVKDTINLLRTRYATDPSKLRWSVPETESALRPSPGPHRSSHAHGRGSPLLLVLVLLALAPALAVACADRPPARQEVSAAGTDGGRGSAGSPTAPALGPTPNPRPAFTVEVDPPLVGRGETLLLRVTGASAGMVSAGGRAVPLVPASSGAWAVIGVGLTADLGPASLTVTARDAQGNAAGEVTTTYTIVSIDRPVDYLVLTEEQGAVLTPDAGARETQQREEQFAAFDATPRWRGAFRHPLAVLDVTTLFGSGRSINGGPIGDFHSGEDLGADEGTPVTAAAPGRVAWVGAMPIRGTAVIIDHGGGVLSGYHHLRDASVLAGQQIDAGALLGHVGSTGLSTGPHLHWELTVYGVNVDPETWTTRLFPR